MAERGLKSMKMITRLFASPIDSCPAHIVFSFRPVFLFILFYFLFFFLEDLVSLILIPQILSEITIFMGIQNVIELQIKDTMY